MKIILLALVMMTRSNGSTGDGIDAAMDDALAFVDENHQIDETEKMQRLRQEFITSSSQPSPLARLEYPAADIASRDWPEVLVLPNGTRLNLYTAAEYRDFDAMPCCAKQAIYDSFRFSKICSFDKEKKKHCHGNSYHRYCIVKRVSLDNPYCEDRDVFIFRLTTLKNLEVCRMGDLIDGFMRNNLREILKNGGSLVLENKFEITLSGNYFVVRPLI